MKRTMNAGVCCLVVVAVYMRSIVGRTVMVEPGDPRKTLFVLEGDSFTLACRDTQAKPIMWEKNGIPISTYGLHRPVITSWVTTEFQTKIALTSLIVRDAGVTDDGVYGCSGVDERPQKVNVVVLALKITDAQLIGRWEEGHNEAFLKCDPDKAALFNANMYWYKDGEKILPLADDDHIMLLDNNHTLYMRELAYPKDAGIIGKYECVLKLPSRGRTYTERAYIRAAAIIDEVRGEEDGGNMLLLCSGHSYPLPRVTWMKDGHVAIPQTEKYDVVTTEEANGRFMSMLIVHGFAARDYGNYTCMADSFKEDYELDDSKTLVFDGEYYSEIETYKVNTAGAVIGSLVGIIVLVYIVVVVIVLILYRRNRNKLVNEEETPPHEESPMLGTPRPRNDTMSETHSLGLPMNNLGTPASDLDDSAKDTTGSINADDVDSNSDNSSIHKEKIPTSEEDTSSSPEHPTIDIDVPTEADPMLEKEIPNKNNSASTDSVDSPPQEDIVVPVRHSPLMNRPPSLQDILDGERARNSDDSETDSEGEAPPLPPKQKQHMEYVDMGGNNNNNRFSTPAPNGSLRRLGDSPLAEDESSIDGDDLAMETEAIIEPQPRQKEDTYNTFV